MSQNSFRRSAGSVKVISAAIGVSASVAMGVLGASYGSDDPGFIASGHGWPLATVTSTTAPGELPIPFASPIITATPCAPRVTLPC